jgi:hypothetical protein
VRSIQESLMGGVVLLEECFGMFLVYGNVILRGIFIGDQQGTKKTGETTAEKR